MAKNSTKTTSPTLEDSISDNKANRDEQGGVEIEEEEEALSLSDLPISLVHMEGHDRSPKHASHEEQGESFDFNFDFGPPRPPLWPEHDMCAADDVFFMGQILPLRLSSDGGGGGSTRYPFRARMSRSGSLELGSSGGSTTATSSRSSSTRSHNSPSSTYGDPGRTLFSAATAAAKHGPVKARNPFQTHPSPRPQIRIPPGRSRTHNSGGRTRRSTIWDIFRLGPVRTPEMELHELKLRGQNGNFTGSSKGSLVSRNSSSNSNSSSSYGSGKVASVNGEIDGGRKSMDKKRGLLGSCKCSVAAVEVPSRSGGANDVAKQGSHREQQAGLEGTKQGNRQETRRQSMSRRRTFEWLKELSHATVALDDRP